MKVQVSKIYNAATAIDQMHIRHELPYRTVREFQQIRRMLKTEAETLISEQAKLIELHNGKTGDNGRISFSNRDDLNAFETAWKNLMDEEVDLDFTPLDVSEYAESVKFDAVDADIDALSAFIILERGDNG